MKKSVKINQSIFTGARSFNKHEQVQGHSINIKGQVNMCDNNSVWLVRGALLAFLECPAEHPVFNHIRPGQYIMSPQGYLDGKIECPTGHSQLEMGYRTLLRDFIRTFG